MRLARGVDGEDWGFFGNFAALSVRLLTPEFSRSGGSFMLAEIGQFVNWVADAGVSQFGYCWRIHNVPNSGG